jgi:hypothetical protein
MKKEKKTTSGLSSDHTKGEKYSGSNSQKFVRSMKVRKSQTVGSIKLLSFCYSLEKSTMFWLEKST